jgi:hypothetical protein
MLHTVLSLAARRDRSLHVLDPVGFHPVFAFVHVYCYSVLAMAYMILSSIATTQAIPEIRPLTDLLHAHPEVALQVMPSFPMTYQLPRGKETERGEKMGLAH